MLPSVKTLMYINKITKEQAKQVRKILEEYEIYQDRFNNHTRYERKVEIALEKIDKIIGGYGVESIDGEYVSYFWQESNLQYINLGDTYNTTLIYDTKKDRFFVGSWGDFVEQNPKRFNY